MLGNVTWIMKGITKKLLSSYGAAIVRQHASIKSILDKYLYSLPPRKKPSQNLLLREKCSQKSTRE